MGFLTRMFETRSKPKWNDLWEGSLNPFVGFDRSHTGVNINRNTAMRMAAVFACVRLLAGSLASLPIHLYRRLPGGGKERATDHPAYNVVHRSPHPLMTAYQWVEMMVYHMEIVGNHYAEKLVNNRQQVIGVQPWNPDVTEVKQAPNGELEYELTEADGNKRVRRTPQMTHIPGLGWDGLKGMSTISYVREAVGLGLAAEEAGARLFGNGMNPGTVFTMPEGFDRKSSDEKAKFSEDLLAAHAGLGKMHTGMIIPNGSTFQNIGINADDAQFLESRKFQVEEIARIFGIPLFMIQSETKSTSWGTGIESMSRGFATFTLRPRAVRIEQVLNHSFLTEAEQEVYFFEFLMDSLMRADQKTRGEFYTALAGVKAIVPNEIREKENMNPVPWGDEPVEMQNLHGSGSQGAPTNENGNAEEKGFKTGGSPRCDCGHEHRAEPDPELNHPRMSIQRSYGRVIRDAMGRVIRRERNDILAGAKKVLRKRTKRTKRTKRNADDLAEFISDFYTRHEEFTAEQVTPAFTALAEAIGAEAMREIGQSWEWNDELRQWIEDYIVAFANRHSNQSRGQLLQLIEDLEADEGIDVNDEVILDALGERFEEWETGLDGALPREGKISRRESVRLGNGFAAAAFFAAGVAALVWRATGSETCPYCMTLNGRSVGPGEVFLAAGASFAPGDAKPLNPRSDIGHPPCHAGCDCIVIPGG